MLGALKDKISVLSPTSLAVTADPHLEVFLRSLLWRIPLQPWLFQIQSFFYFSPSL